MGSSSDNFDPLEKLLRLKRYEKPPPRYFRDFSGKVITRIERGEGRSGSAWWERFGVDLRAVMTAGAGMIACGLVVFGLGFTLDADSQDIALSAGTLPGVLPTGIAASGDFGNDGVEVVPFNSTNPVVNPAPAFGNPWRGQITPVNYQMPR